MKHIYEIQSAVNASMSTPATVAWLTNDPKQAKAWSIEAGLWNEVKSFLSSQSNCRIETLARIERKQPAKQISMTQEVAA